MKILLTTNDQITRAIDQYGCKRAAGMNSIISDIFRLHWEQGEEECEIVLMASTLAPSYITNPSMFANTLRARASYVAVRAFRKGKFIHIIGSSIIKPRTFTARVEEGLKEEGRIRIPRKEIPSTYRLRPQTLTPALEIRLDKKIKVIKQPKHIIWKLLRTTQNV